jgi:mannose-6-phosphate isomerase-like protein (cupin superfamily)
MEKDEEKICKLCDRKTCELDWDTHWKKCHLCVVEDVKSESIHIDAYHHVMRTSAHAQQAYMHLEPNEDIPMGVHENSTQIILVLGGKIKASIDGGEWKKLYNGAMLWIPEGHKYGVRNASGRSPAKLMRIYAPPLPIVHGLDSSDDKPR